VHRQQNRQKLLLRGGTRIRQPQQGGFALPEADQNGGIKMFIHSKMGEIETGAHRPDRRVKTGQKTSWLDS